MEFTYNRVMHSTIQYPSFEIVQGFNLLTPLDLSPLPNTSLLKHKDGKTKANFVNNCLNKLNCKLIRKMKFMPSMQTKG